jgi:hypothetical protein
MRSFLTLALILFSIYVEGQFLSAPGTYIHARNASNASDREIYIWSEDFADGIPTTWNNSGAPTLAVGLQQTPINSLAQEDRVFPTGTWEKQ